MDIARTEQRKKGIFLSLDVSIALLILFTAIILAFTYFNGTQDYGASNMIVRNSLQDAATVIGNEGGFTSPLVSAARPDTSSISEVFAATPESVCLQAEAYGVEIPSGLVGYWKLDEDSGAAIATDSSGNGRAGAIYGGVTFAQQSQSGKAFVFDGASGYIDTGFDFGWNSGSSATWSFWVNPGDISGTYDILGKPNEWVFYQSGTTMGFQYFDSDGGSGGGSTNGMDASWGAVFSSGNWTHLVYVWNGTASRLYANGVLVDTHVATNSSLNMDGNSTVQIGGNIFATSTYFKGMIDDVRVYNRALNSSEVARLYANPANLLYVVSKADCAYSGGDIQVLHVPFSANLDQNDNSYYYAVMRAWTKGAGESSYTN